MKRAIFSLFLLASVSCSSNKPTDTFVPIDSQQLIGQWEGTYALTYDTGTDSARTYEVDMWIVFSDTSFSFDGDDSGPCATCGQGSYWVEGRVLRFRNEIPRIMICTWENTLMGEFTYNYNFAVTHLSMTQRWGRFLWQVEVTRVPEIIHH